MLLVDGDYCSKVEHKCLKSWYDKSNKKVVYLPLPKGTGLFEDLTIALYRALRIF